jgi:hypothetical protein
MPQSSIPDLASAASAQVIEKVALLSVDPPFQPAVDSPGTRNGAALRVLTSSDTTVPATMPEQ